MIIMNYFRLPQRMLYWNRVCQSCEISRVNNLNLSSIWNIFHSMSDLNNLRHCLNLNLAKFCWRRINTVLYLLWSLMNRFGWDYSFWLCFIFDLRNFWLNLQRNLVYYCWRGLDYFRLFWLCWRFNPPMIYIWNALLSCRGFISMSGVSVGFFLLSSLCFLLFELDLLIGLDLLNRMISSLNLFALC